VIEIKNIAHSRDNHDNRFFRFEMRKYTDILKAKEAKLRARLCC